MGIDYWDIEDPTWKQASHTGGGGGVGGPGPGPAGGFVSFSGGGVPGFSAGGYDFNTEATTDPKKALVKRIMDAIMAMQQPPHDNVNANLQSGEFVVNAPATAMAGPELEKLNAAGNRARGYFLGGPVSLLGGVSAPTSVGAGAGVEAGAGIASLGWIPAAIEAVKFVSSILSKPQGGPNGLERVGAMGEGFSPQEREGYAYGGYVGGPFGGRLANRFGGPRQNWNPYAPPDLAPTPAPQTTAPSTTNTPGSTLPTTAIDELLKNYNAQGAFGANYGLSELEASLNRQNQGAQEADVRDLMASGLDDPSLYASQLLASRGARSKQASSLMADARLKQTQSAQDWIRGLLGSRHDDQIKELLARIK